MNSDRFHTQETLPSPSGPVRIYRLDRVASPEQLDRLPYSIRVLLEGALRNDNGRPSGAELIQSLIHWQPQQEQRPSISFFPGRVVLQDFTGVPVMNDLAAMRAALARRGGDPARINPVTPVDLVIDHSIQVDYYGSSESADQNARVEFERNRERYEFLHWAQRAFRNFRVVPPSTGIVHQVNLEYLASVVLTREIDGATVAFPDTCVGTDSHTTMINGLGVVGWGVGGIEAVAAMLDQPIEIVMPDVIGFRLTGQLREGVTPTDLTLTITQILRKRGVVDRFVEFFGPGLDHLSLADRAMIANMSPENGATLSFFPVDDRTLDYLRLSGRAEAQIGLVEAYCKAQRLFRLPDAPDPIYTDVIELDMSSIEPSLAGPRRPQDRVPLHQMRTVFQAALAKPKTENGLGLAAEELGARAELIVRGQPVEMRHGAVAIAAITSCTNTSNPAVMIAAGLVAQKAHEKGLTVPAYVKTSLAPGSRVVTGYLEAAGLLEPLAALGFDLVGYGCTTCIGNSGPLEDAVVQAIQKNNLVTAAVLSGNRNFEGRVSPHTRVNYLASPPLVVAFALAGSVDIDLDTQPLGTGADGAPVFLRDVWPTSAEIESVIAQTVRPELFASNYAGVFSGNPAWNAIPSTGGQLYAWSDDSTYLQEPPFFEARSAASADINGARVLAIFGDSITTDHISPAGSIPVKSAAGQYLLAHGVAVEDFNSFGARRGNDRVMTRGTFANIRLKNLLLPGMEGSWTVHQPSGEQMSIYDAAARYRQDGAPLVILAGKEYGTGSSRDWAAKGVLLLGVRAVIAESFERIHRSNLAGMGVLPLQFTSGQNAQTLGLTGQETFDITEIAGEQARVTVRRPDGSSFEFKAVVRLDTETDWAYFRAGGLLNAVLDQMRA